MAQNNRRKQSRTKYVNPQRVITSAGHRFPDDWARQFDDIMQFYNKMKESLRSLIFRTIVFGRWKVTGSALDAPGMLWDCDFFNRGLGQRNQLLFIVVDDRLEVFPYTPVREVNDYGYQHRFNVVTWGPNKRIIKKVYTENIDCVRVQDIKSEIAVHSTISRMQLSEPHIDEMVEALTRGFMTLKVLSPKIIVEVDDQGQIEGVRSRLARSLKDYNVTDAFASAIGIRLIELNNERYQGLLKEFEEKYMDAYNRLMAYNAIPNEGGNSDKKAQMVTVEYEGQSMQVSFQHSVEMDYWKMVSEKIKKVLNKDLTITLRIAEIMEQQKEEAQQEQEAQNVTTSSND